MKIMKVNDAVFNDFSDIKIPFIDPVFMSANPTSFIIMKTDNKILTIHRRSCRFKNHSTKYRHRITTSEDCEAFSESYTSRNKFIKEKVESLQNVHGQHASDLATILIKNVASGIDYKSSSPDTYAIIARVGKVFIPVVEKSTVRF